MNKPAIYISIAITVSIPVLYNLFQRNRKDIPVFIRKKLLKGYNARTIPPFGIFMSESQKENKELLAHETIHWQQYQQKGLIGFYSSYIKEIKTFGYDKMPMEVEARKTETEYCKQNYTECVRNGFSNTVYNPNFRT